MSAEYELVLMLDPEAPDERRDKIASDARTRIEAAGGLKAERSWGMRKLAYEIEQRTEADYRFFRFETGDELLGELDHNLKITDGVLRFRIFKVDPRAPVIEPPPPVSLASSAPSRGPGGPRGRGRREDGSEEQATPRAEAPAPPAEPVAAPVPAESPAPTEASVAEASPAAPEPEPQAE